MFSKIIKQPFRAVTTRVKRLFSCHNFQKAGFSSLKKTVSELFNPVFADNVQTKIANFDPLKQVTVKLEKSPLINEIQPLDNIIRENGDAKHEITKLSNGVTILTESGLYPNVIDLGIVFFENWLRVIFQVFLLIWVLEMNPMRLLAVCSH